MTNGGHYEPLQISASLQAQPRPLWQTFEAWMQLLPHGLPVEQTRQHVFAGRHAAGDAGPRVSSKTELSDAGGSPA